MRQFTILFLLCFSFCISCTGVWKPADNIKDFIPGTYAKEVRNESCIAHDTLIIQCIRGNNYLIANWTAYQLIRYNKLLPERHREEDWKALYDEPSQNLNEQRLGKTFSFDPANNRLYDGASPYSKISP